MKNMLRGVALGGSMLVLTGCATPVPMGALMTDISFPVAVTSSSAGNKMGVATCKSILGMVSSGDCSIETAKRNGGISTVSHVDWNANNILGIIGNYELVVYGQ